MGSKPAVPTKTLGRSGFLSTPDSKPSFSDSSAGTTGAHDELNNQDPPTTRLTCDLLDGTDNAVRLRLLATAAAAHQRFLMLRHSNFPLAGHAESKLVDFRPCGLC